jgi:hypothetical protein
VFDLDGQEYKTTDLVTAFNEENALIAAAANATSDWKSAVAAMRAKTAANNKLRLALHTALKQALGANSPKLGQDFGYAQRARKVPTPAKTAEAVQKRAATRVARGTMGPRQRQEIHGVVEPAPAPLAPASSAAASDAPNGAPSSTTLK